MRASAVSALFSLTIALFSSDVCADDDPHVRHDLGIIAATVGQFTPQASTGGLVLILEEVFQRFPTRAGAVSVGLGVLNHDRTARVLATLHGGVRWIPSYAHAIEFGVGTDLIFDPSGSTPLAEYGIGTYVEHLFRFGGSFFLVTHVGIGASWMYHNVFTPGDAGARPQFTWINGIGTHLLTF